MQKGSPREAGQILIWIIVGALVVVIAGGAYYLGRSTSPKPSPTPNVASQTPQPTPSSTPNVSVTTTPKHLDVTTPYKIISSDDVSPDQKYVIGQIQIGDYVTIEIARNNAGTANYITTDLVKENGKEIGYNVKFGCMCATYFEGWISDDKFIIKVTNGNGEEYEYAVDAKIGKVDESSLKRIK